MLNDNKKEEYLVADYMRKDVVTLQADAVFKDAVGLMLKKHTNGVVVIDCDKRVTGILSSWDLIQYIVPNYLEDDKHLAPFESGDFFKERVREVAEHPIAKFMTTKVHTVREDATIMEAAALLSEYRIRQLPVVNESGSLIGYLNRTDIKHAMGDVLWMHRDKII